MNHIRFLAIVVILLSVGCDSAPTKPKPVPAKTFYAYGMDQRVGERYFRLNPQDGDFDTLMAKSPRRGPIAIYPSANGQLLYFPFAESTRVYMADPFGYQKTIPYGAGSVECSPNGQYIAMIFESSAKLIILRLPEYEVVYRNETTPLIAGSFSTDGRTYYTAMYNQGRSDVLRITLEPSPHENWINIPDSLGGITKLATSPDEQLLYFKSFYASFWWAFCVFDLAGDSTLMLYHLVPGNQEMAIVPNGHTVFFSNSMPMDVGPPPPTCFYRYDVGDNRVRVISTAHLKPPAGGAPGGLRVGMLCVTPDSRTLVAAEAGGSSFFTYDIANDRVTDYFSYDWHIYMYSMNMQNGL